jgi:hypothetical protein
LIGFSVGSGFSAVSFTCSLTVDTGASGMVMSSVGGGAGAVTGAGTGSGSGMGCGFGASLLAVTFS